MAKARGLGAIEDQMRQARDLMAKFVALNPSSDDKNDIDLKLSKCEALYEAENVVNLPVISHIMSGICFDELVEKLQKMIVKYTKKPPAPPTPKDEGLPWYAWVGIGVGGLSVLGMLAYAMMPKTSAIQTTRKAA